MGGLGNQLFQIFAIISYSIEFKHSYFFFNEENTIGCTHRSTYWNSLLNKVVLFNKEKNVNFHLILKEDPEYITKTILDFPIDKNILLYGYFQSYKYFKENIKSICKLIKLENQQNNIKNIYSYDYQNSISIHFRLGDYKNLQDYHPILIYDYYKNSIQYILSTKERTHFNVLYFCEKEDNYIVEKTIQKLKIDFPDCTFTKIDDNIEDWYQMLIMSLCNYNIIANSSFSWWGAYFNSNIDKIVCYPERWFGPKLSKNNTNDLFPEDWIKISEK
jgi:hypothetical protein